MATVELDRPPRVRYAAALLPRTRPAGLPDLELVLPAVRTSAEHLAAYNRVCGFRLAGALPPTYPHVLAFPLALRLLLDPAFPFPALGLVHLANRIDQARPLHLGEPFALRVRATDARPHERGTAFDIAAEATAGAEPVWAATSTYLHRTSTAGRPPGAPREEAGQWPPAQAVWRLPADLGRRYAAVSGDRNPIHLHRLTARPFGYRRPIAHGMWAQARCLAALEGRLPAALTVEVTFRRPVLLPGQVAFHAAPTADGHRVALTDPRTARPHLTGTVTRRSARSG